jgi:hypothetical protein
MDKRRLKEGKYLSRIEVDEQLEKDLDQIKSEKCLYGKGHTSTIRHLVNHYKQHKEVSEVLHRELSRIPEQMKESITEVLQRFFLNLLKPRE